MEPMGTEPVTELLLRWRAGDQECLNRLLPQVEGELRRIAHRYMRMERQGHTLQTTALVNEAYMKLVDQSRANWQNRAQFVGIAASLMRRILVDHARNRCREKRGGGARKVSLDEALTVSQDRAEDLLVLDEALTALAGFDERKGRVVELKYFGGLSVEETAEVLQVSTMTVLRDWKLAKAWLYSRVTEGAADGL